MKKIFRYLFIFLFLTACAPAPVIQTSEVSETSEVLPATATPVATAISASSSTPESPTAILTGSPTWFDAEDVEGATPQTAMMNGSEKQAWVLPDDRVIAADVNGDGKIERVSEYDDGAGHKLYTWINMELGMGPSGAFQIKDTTAAGVIFERLFDELSQGQFAGMTPEQVREKLLAGPVDLWVPRAPANPGVDNTAVEWEQLKGWDVSKGIELVLVGSESQLKALPAEWQGRIMDQRGTEQIVGGALIVAEDGHLVLVGVQSDIVANFEGLQRVKMEKDFDKLGLNLSTVRRNGSQGVGRLTLIPLDLLSDFMDVDAFLNFSNNATALDNLGRQIVNPFTEAWWDGQAQ